MTMPSWLSSGLVYGAALAVFLIVAGVCGLVGSSDAGAYEVANKPTVPATVVETHREGSSKNPDCAVTVSEASGQVTLAIDDISACDPYSRLQPGTHVDVEYWNGKATAIYDDNDSWPTKDNPAHNAALATLSAAGGVVLGLVIAIALGVWFLIRFLFARNRPADARREAGRGGIHGRR